MVLLLYYLLPGCLSCIQLYLETIFLISPISVITIEHCVANHTSKLTMTVFWSKYVVQQFICLGATVLYIKSTIFSMICLQ
jgi:hypothetical protein